MDNLTQEKLIALALFKSTVEHSTHLIGHFKKEAKQDFNIWMKQGFKILESVEKNNPEFYAVIQEIADVIHNGISEAKKDAV